MAPGGLRTRRRALLAVAATLWAYACASDQRSGSKGAPAAASGFTGTASVAPTLAQPASSSPASLPSPPAAAPPKNRPLDPKALERLVADARASGSAELVILKDGQQVASFETDPGGGPIQTMS